MANSFNTKKTSSIVAILAAILLLILQQFGLIDKPNTSSNEQRPPTSANSTQRTDTISKDNATDIVRKNNENTIQPPKTSGSVEQNDGSKKNEINKYSKDDKKSSAKATPTQAPQTTESGEQSAGSILAELGQKKIVYTRHAQCRMDCRYISEREIKDILKRGKINHRKSKPYDSPCPSYAVEGKTKDRQEVRIVFAKCDDVTKVITAIDLERKYSCHCD